MNLKFYGLIIGFILIILEIFRSLIKIRGTDDESVLNNNNQACKIILLRRKKREKKLE